MLEPENCTRTIFHSSTYLAAVDWLACLPQNPFQLSSYIHAGELTKTYIFSFMVMPWPTLHVIPVPVSLSPAYFVPLSKHHDQCRNNGQDLLLKGLQDLEILQTELADSEEVYLQKSFDKNLLQFMREGSVTHNLSLVSLLL